MKTEDLLLLGGAGALIYYFWKKSEDEKAAAQAALVGTQLVPGGSGASAQILPPPTATKIADPVAAAIAPIADQIAPGLGGIIGAGVSAEINVVGGIIEDPGSTRSLTEIGIIAGTAGAALPLFAIADLTGLSPLLWGHPLDAVNDILLQPWASPIAAGNVQPNQPIYAMDKDKVLHKLVTSDINGAKFSWREIIAVSPLLISHGGFQFGPDITSRDQIDPFPRPAKPEDIRGVFGCDVIFKIGNSNDLYGPQPLLAPGNNEWAQKYGPVNCSPYPGSPAANLQAYASAVSARARAAGF